MEFSIGMVEFSICAIIKFSINKVRSLWWMICFVICMLFLKKKKQDFHLHDDGIFHTHDDGIFHLCNDEIFH